MKRIKELFLKLIILIPSPIHKNRLFFSSIPSMSDNSLALFDYLIKMNVNYDMWWQLNAGEKNKLKYKKVVVKGGNIFQKIKYYHVLKTSKIIILTHHPLPLRKKQKMITLWHGEPFKKWDNDISNLVIDKDNNWFVTANSNTEYLRKKIYHLTKINYYHSAQCRISFFFNETFVNPVKKLLSDLKIGNFIVFMPTFRGSDKNFDFLSFDYKKINEELLNNGIFLFIKLHPHYNLGDFSAFKNYTNIKLIDKNFFEQNNIELYSFLSQSSGLITDFSSVFIDYIFLNKPIAFQIYKEEDIISNAVNCGLNELPGELIFETDDIISFCIKSCHKPIKFSESIEANRQLIKNAYLTDNGLLEDGPKNVAQLIENIIN